MRDCGDCTLCCLFMKVPEYGSLEYEYCSNCIPDKGCSIYENRQDVCRDFGCLWWLQEQIPESLRPDKIGVMFEVTSSSNLILGYVNSERPDCWKHHSVQRMIGRIVQADYSVILHLGKGKDNKIFQRKGDNTSDVLQELMKVELHGRSLIHN